MAPRAKGMERQRHRACEVDAHQEGRQHKSERESDDAAEGTNSRKKWRWGVQSQLSQKADSQISSHSPRFVWDNLRHPVGRYGL